MPGSVLPERHFPKVAVMPFPTEPILTSEATHGEITRRLITPPVQAGKLALRIRAVTISTPDGQVSYADWSLEAGAGWSDFKSKDQWAAVAYGNSDHFKSDHNRAIPTQLYVKWMEAVFRFLCAHEPTVLQDRLDDIAAWKKRRTDAARAKRDDLRAFQRHFGKLEHGDVAIAQRPLSFRGGELMVQYFVMLKGAGGRPGLTPCIHSTTPYEAFLPVTRSGSFAARLMKVGPRAFERAPNLSAHDRLHLLGLAEEMHRRCANGCMPSPRNAT